MTKFKPLWMALLLQLAFGLVIDSTEVRAQSKPATAVEDDEDAPKTKALAPMSTEEFSKEVLGILAALEKHHIKPPARTDMVAAGFKAFYEAAKQELPEDLKTGNADINDVQSLSARIDPVLKKADGPTQAKLQMAFLKGIDLAVPGKFALVDKPNRKEMAVQEQIAANRYVGIGIMLEMNAKAKQPEIRTAMIRGAARNAGIKAGDIVETVDGKDTTGKPMAEVVDWLRGPEGSTVTVKVRQRDAKESRTYTMTRAKVAFEHVFGFRRVGEEDFDFRADSSAPIAYLRLGGFSSSTLHELRVFERKLRTAGYRALVLDLRGTGGGGLQHAALVAGGLVNGGRLWTITQKEDPAPREFKAEQECLFRDWPMVVLIGGKPDLSTALNAAALQDSGRAKLVGEPSPEDGFIRSIIDLPGHKWSIMLPTARIERRDAPTGWPLEPDYLVKLTPEQAKALGEWDRLQEMSDKPRDPKAPRPADPQLDKAIELLRADLQKLKVTQK